MKLALILLSTLAGCADYAMDNGAPQERAADDDGFASGTLRVDIVPGNSGEALLPQTFILAPEGYGEGVTVRHELQPTVTVSGRITAEVLQGWESEAALSGPVAAVVRAERQGHTQSGAAATDEDGDYSFGLPGSQPYTISVVPSNPSAVAFQVFTAQAVGLGLALDLEVPLGAPVYGRVTDAAGTARSDVELRIRRADVDVASSTFVPGDSGWYVARVAPGYDYVLETVGGAAGLGLVVPSLSVPFTVLDESGAKVDINVGAADVARFDAVVTDPQGVPFPSAHARFTSVELSGSDGSLTLEVDPQSDGSLTKLLLKGTWKVEVWPSADFAQYSPWSTTVTIDDDVNVGEAALTAPITVSGTVRAEEGGALAGATLVATQQGFAGYTVSAVADERGEYSLRLPRGDWSLTTSPADPTTAATFSEPLSLGVADDRSNFDVALPAGTELTGEVRSGDQLVPFSLVEVTDPNSGELLGRAIADADGRYRLRLVIPTADEGDTGGPDTGDPADTGDHADTGDSGEAEDTAGDTARDTGA